MSGISLIPTFPWPAVTACETEEIVPVIGWYGTSSNTPRIEPAARTNTGGVNIAGNPNPWPFSGFVALCGIVGYTSGTVVWSTVWAPTSGGAAPTLDESTPGVLGITGLVNGLLTITATLDGVSVGAGQGLELSRITTGYGFIAWGPEP